MDDGPVRLAGNIVTFPLASQEHYQWGDNVERVNHYPLYELGKALHALESNTVDNKEVDGRALYYAVVRAKSAVSRLLSGTPFPLGISRTATEELKKAIEGIEDHHFTEKKDDKKQFKMPSSGETILFWDWLWGMNDLIRKFETIFSTEMNGAATYFVPSRGIYSTAALIDFADKSFPENIFGHIPEKAKSDWRAAGRCLAFSLLSATGFHVARAVEATLEVYYQLYTGAPGTLHSWHDYLKALEAVASTGSSPAPASKTLAELRQMKDDYRNPVMHPRVTLSENDARILFDNGESLIIAMAEEIKAIREAGGVQGSLAVVGGSSLDDEIPF
jgi:hypothetical protein